MYCVLIVTFYGGSTSTMATLLIAAHVKDAVRIDGSDSILFGSGTDIKVDKDDQMSDYRKYYNKWGYMTLKG